MSLVIKRSDGKFYAATADFKPVWADDRENAAHFRDKAAADVRVAGLEKLETEGRTFEIEAGS